MKVKFFIETVKGISLDDFSQMTLEEIYALMDEYADWKVKND